MPHQCLGCNTLYDNTSNAILKGCPKCGKKLFLYVKKMPENKADQVEISKENKNLIMKELDSIVQSEKLDSDTPIILNLENIRILKPGKYELDINQLMKREKPVVYRVQEGTYVIDLNSIKESVTDVR